MVSINPSFKGRVLGQPKTISVPQNAESEAQQTPVNPQPATLSQLQTATVDSTTFLANRGISINPPQNDAPSLEQNKYQLDDISKLGELMGRVLTRQRQKI